MSSYQEVETKEDLHFATNLTLDDPGNQNLSNFLHSNIKPIVLTTLPDELRETETESQDFRNILSSDDRTHYEARRKYREKQFEVPYTLHNPTNLLVHNRTMQKTLRNRFFITATYQDKTL